MRKRLAAKLTGITVTRPYSANQNPKNLVTGGSSAFNANALSSTKTPAVVWRNELEKVELEILIPEENTGGTSAAATYVTIDTSRDWRKANFKAFWSVAAVGAGNSYFGEESANTGSASTRQMPADVSLYLTAGQSWEEHPALAGYRIAGVITFGTTTSANGGATPDWVTAADTFALVVDNTTGELKFRRVVTGSSAGAPVWVVLEAYFSHGR